LLPQSCEDGRVEPAIASALQRCPIQRDVIATDNAGQVYDWSFRAGIPEGLFEAHVDPEARRNHYLVTSDGKRFLVNVLAEEQKRADFTVVLNWPALLKR
jgi:hypothetical protein